MVVRSSLKIHCVGIGGPPVLDATVVLLVFWDRETFMNGGGIYELPGLQYATFWEYWQWFSEHKDDRVYNSEKQKELVSKNPILC